MLSVVWIGCWFVCCVHTLEWRAFIHAGPCFHCHAVFRADVTLIKTVISDCRRLVPTVRTTRWKQVLVMFQPLVVEFLFFSPTVRFLFMSRLIPILLNFRHSPQKRFILLVTSSTTFHKYFQSEGKICACRMVFCVLKKTLILFDRSLGHTGFPPPNPLGIHSSKSLEGFGKNKKINSFLLDTL